MRILSVPTIPLLCLLVFSLCSSPVQAADNDKCVAAETTFLCPNPDVCPDSGYSEVTQCLDCNGNLNTYYEGKECFDRRLLNGRDNPSKSYLWRDIAGIVVWFLAAGVGALRSDFALCVLWDEVGLSDPCLEDCV